MPHRLHCVSAFQGLPAWANMQGWAVDIIDKYGLHQILRSTSKIQKLTEIVYFIR